MSFWYLLPVSDETHPPRKASQENTGTRLQRWAVARCPVSAAACSTWGGPAPPNRPSLICRVSVSAAHLAEQQYLAGRGGLSCHCNKDSFVNIRLLGTEGFWEEKASPTPSPLALPPPRGGGVLFLSLASPRRLFVLSLDLLLVPLSLHVAHVSFRVTRSLFSRPYCERRARVCCPILAMPGGQLGCN